MRISGATAMKQRNKRTLSPSDYAIVQQILEKGRIKKDGKNGFVGFLQIGGKWWKVAWKSVPPDMDEIWITTLHRSSIKQQQTLNIGEVWIKG